jgi:hypothetical protein
VPLWRSVLIYILTPVISYNTVAKRQNDFGSHNGKQGSAVVSQNNVSVKKTGSNNGSSSDSSSSTDTTTSSSSSSDDADTSSSSTSTSDDADDDECEEDEDDDEDDCEGDEDDDADDCEDDEDDADDCEEGEFRLVLKSRASQKEYAPDLALGISFLVLSQMKTMTLMTARMTRVSFSRRLV